MERLQAVIAQIKPSVLAELLLAVEEIGRDNPDPWNHFKYWAERYLLEGLIKKNSSTVRENS